MAKPTLPLNTAKDFIEYWDYNIKEWMKNGILTEQEQFWPDKAGLITNLVPEPYYGDPEKCSIVIVNFNPGAGDEEKNLTQNFQNVGNEDTVCGLINKEGSYSSIAKKFPMLDEQDVRNPFKRYTNTKEERKGENEGHLNFPGYKWWNKKNVWFEDLSVSKKKPFALELCAWHSRSWSLKKEDYTEKLLNDISYRIKSVLIEAIQNSDLKIGICIGSPFQKILKHMEFEPIDLVKPAEPLDFLKIPEGYHPDTRYFVNDETEIVRGYRLYQHRITKVYIINTWVTGSNNYPTQSFKKFEKELIKSILTRMETKNS